MSDRKRPRPKRCPSCGRPGKFYPGHTVCTKCVMRAIVVNSHSSKWRNELVRVSQPTR